jgi:hypothetical protein
MLNVQFSKPTPQAKVLASIRAGYVVTQESLIRARAMIVDCLQSHPLDFPEVHWNGKAFSVQRDE